MASQKTPEELYPNLFGSRAATASTTAAKPGLELKTSDMRLLQYCMRQASKRPPSLSAPAAPAQRNTTRAGRLA